MSCGLSEDALLALNILYHNRCFRTDRGYNSKKLENILSKKTTSNFGDIVKELLDGRYIAPIKKKDMKYYISDMQKAIFALDLHSFSVTKGKVRKL
jgi:hypothetical protein